MNDDPVLTLERELVDAARRRLGHGRPAAPPQPQRPLGALAMLLPAAVAITVVVIALAALRGRPPAHHAARRPARPAAVQRSRRRLLDIVSVLSRPQTSTDLRVLRQSGLLGSPDPTLAGATVDIASARVAAIAPWGSRVLLTLINPPTPAQLAAFERQFPGFPAPRRPVNEVRLAMWVDHGGGAGEDAAGIQAGGDWSISGAGHAFAGGSTATRIYVLVPDGVAKVAFYSPPQSVQSGGPTYRRGLTVTVPVHGNIAATEIHRQCCAGPLMIWYAADGRVIKRVGDFAAAEHAPVPPQPSPPTALSRRALRDPSAPNPVTAVPRTGGPNTTFAISFRQLISDADYRFGFVSAPTGSGCRLGRSTSNPDGGPDDVRGRIFTFRYTAPAGGWCPGTYRFSVSLTDLGRAGALRSGHAAPFGTASFVVRR